MKPTDAILHPADWQTATVGQAVELRRGISWSKEQEYSAPRDGAVPVIRIGNVQECLELDDLIYIAGLKPKAVEKKRVNAGWSIMVGSNGNRQRVGNAVFIGEDKGFLFASFLIAAKPRNGVGISPTFFHRWLATEQVQAYLSASSEGTTGLNNLSHSFFKAMAIPFPESQDEQAAIAQVLDSVDTALEHTRIAIERAQSLRKSLIQNLLLHGLRKEQPKKSPAGLIPGGWKCDLLGQHIASGPTNGVYRPETEYGHTGTRIVRIDSYADGEIHSLARLWRVRVPEVVTHRYALAKDDILINRVNSLSHIGKAALVPELDEPTIFESNMIRLRCDTVLLPEFLIIVLCSDVARRHWLSRAKPAVNQASINQRDVKELPVPIPEPDEQRDIVSIVTASKNHLRQLAGVAAAQHALKKSLMHDLLTGAKRVTNLQPILQT